MLGVAEEGGEEAGVLPAAHAQQAEDVDAPVRACVCVCVFMVGVWGWLVGLFVGLKMLTLLCVCYGGLKFCLFCERLVVERRACLCRGFWGWGLMGLFVLRRWWWNVVRIRVCLGGLFVN